MYLELTTNQNFILNELMRRLSMETAFLHSVLIPLSSSDQYNPKLLHRSVVYVVKLHIVAELTVLSCVM